MSKRPTDDYEPAAKKRGSGRQLTKDDVSDDEAEEKGSIETATEDVMKGRRVLKARRTGSGAPPPAAGAPPAANPFSGVSLTGGGNGFAALATAQPAEKAEAAKPAPAAEPAVASKPAGASEASAPAEPAGSGAAAAEPKLTAADAKPAEAEQEQAGGAAAPAFASFASTAAPFAATAGSRPLFNFGTVAASGAGGDSNGSAPGGAFSFAGAAAGAPGAFSFKPPEGGFPSVQSIFGAGASADQQNGGEEEGGRGLKPALAMLPPEAERTTGEEGEETLWAGEGTLYEFSAAKAWAERGKGELRLNCAPGQAARFVMRQKGYLRLLMNARLWPGMTVSRMDGGKGATFPVVNAVPGPGEKDGGEPRLRTFAFRLKSAGQLDAFIAAVEAHRGQPDAPAAAAAAGDAPAAEQAAKPAEEAQA